MSPAMADEPSPEKSSKAAQTAILIGASGVVLFAAILLPPYLRHRSESRRTADFVAAAQPTIDALIDAEAKYKQREGKFWRDRGQTLSAEGTKQALGVELPANVRFEVYPPDLVADPTLRIAAAGTGAADGLRLECLYDSIQKSKSCKQL
jgi:hypothetical protein